MGGLIPFRNTPALISYYLGVFSLIPIIGIPLGVIAVIHGITGLKKASVTPEAKGKVHAWAGIVLGTLAAVAYTLLIIIPIIASMS